MKLKKKLSIVRKIMKNKFLLALILVVIALLLLKK